MGDELEEPFRELSLDQHLLIAPLYYDDGLNDVFYLKRGKY